LAAARPIAVVCEQHSYLRGIVTDACCGEAFSNGDAAGLANFIRRLAADRKLVKQMGQAGRHYLLSHFTPELIAKQYSEVLHEAVFSNVKSSGYRTVGQVSSESIPIHKKV
jgi:glycosyltransferase involved in cell wall biosynthesis